MARSEIMHPSPMVAGPWVETTLARGCRTAFEEMVMRWWPVSMAESATMQVGEREVGALGREDAGRGRVFDILCRDQR